MGFLITTPPITETLTTRVSSKGAGIDTSVLRKRGTLMGTELPGNAMLTPGTITGPVVGQGRPKHLLPVKTPQPRHQHVVRVRGCELLVPLRVGAVRADKTNDRVDHGRIDKEDN